MQEIELVENLNRFSAFEVQDVEDSGNDLGQQHNVEDTSSQNTKFVDATQIGDLNNIAGEEEEVQQETSEDKVRRNSEFLKKSWG